eukprot:118870-Pyramimonas_sp.AAC.4
MMSMSAEVPTSWTSSASPSGTDAAGRRILGFLAGGGARVSAVSAGEASPSDSGSSWVPVGGGPRASSSSPSDSAPSSREGDPAAGAAAASAKLGLFLTAGERPRPLP